MQAPCEGPVDGGPMTPCEGLIGPGNGRVLQGADGGGDAALFRWAMPPVWCPISRSL